MTETPFWFRQAILWATCHTDRFCLLACLLQTGEDFDFCAVCGKLYNCLLGFCGLTEDVTASAVLAVLVESVYACYKELGNHLHFELLVSGQNVNPELYLDKELS